MVKHGPKKDDPGLILLIPELCCITGKQHFPWTLFFIFIFQKGISDSMRQDFSLMKEMSTYTHVGPNEWL